MLANCSNAVFACNLYAAHLKISCGREICPDSATDKAPACFCSSFMRRHLILTVGGSDTRRCVFYFSASSAA